MSFCSGSSHLVRHGPQSEVRDIVNLLIKGRGGRKLARYVPDKRVYIKDCLITAGNPSPWDEFSYFAARTTLDLSYTVDCVIQLVKVSTHIRDNSILIRRILFI